jgi:hypothetical protein
LREKGEVEQLVGAGIAIDSIVLCAAVATEVDAEPALIELLPMDTPVPAVVSGPATDTPAPVL